LSDHHAKDDPSRRSTGAPTGALATGAGRDALGAHIAGLDERRRQIAIALHYDRGDPSLPRVVASGSGGVAAQILTAAFAAGIKVREDADLAEILAAVEVDSEIPLEALAAVAEILSYVYRANGAADQPASRPAGPHSADPAGDGR
jgi:flagellar biosynthesis protein